MIQKADNQTREERTIKRNELNGAIRRLPLNRGGIKYIRALENAESWCQQAKKSLKDLRKICEHQAEQEKRKWMMEAIQRRAEKWAHSNKKKDLIANILARDTEKELVDRVWDQITGQVITEETEVKERTWEHFDKNNRVRKWRLEEYWKNW
jgi:hypothetical protein